MFSKMKTLAQTSWRRNPPRPPPNLEKRVSYDSSNFNSTPESYRSSSTISTDRAMADEIHPVPPLADQVAAEANGPVAVAQVADPQDAVAQVAVAPVPGRLRKWLRYRPLWWIALFAFFHKHAALIFYVLLISLPMLIFSVSLVLLGTSVYSLRFQREFKSSDEARFRKVSSLPRGVTYAVVGMAAYGCFICFVQLLWCRWSPLRSTFKYSYVSHMYVMYIMFAGCALAIDLTLAKRAVSDPFDGKDYMYPIIGLECALIFLIAFYATIPGNPILRQRTKNSHPPGAIAIGPNYEYGRPPTPPVAENIPLANIPPAADRDLEAQNEPVLNPQPVNDLPQIRLNDAPVQPAAEPRASITSTAHQASAVQNTSRGRVRTVSSFVGASASSASSASSISSASSGYSNIPSGHRSSARPVSYGCYSTPSSAQVGPRNVSSNRNSLPVTPSQAHIAGYGNNGQGNSSGNNKASGGGSANPTFSRRSLSPATQAYLNRYGMERRIEESRNAASRRASSTITRSSPRAANPIDASGPLINASPGTLSPMATIRPKSRAEPVEDEEAEVDEALANQHQRREQGGDRDESTGGAGASV